MVSTVWRSASSIVARVTEIEGASTTMYLTRTSDDEVKGLAMNASALGSVVVLVPVAAVRHVANRMVGTETMMIDEETDTGRGEEVAIATATSVITDPDDRQRGYATVGHVTVDCCSSL